jgi:hypothetical protein
VTELDVKLQRLNELLARHSVDVLLLQRVSSFAWATCGAASYIYAWNPSITGTKSEDTILVGPGSNEVLTSIPDWPMLIVEAKGQNIPRPAILEVS